MATINFELKKTAAQRKNNTGESMLMLRYSHQSRVVYFYTKKNIKDICWDKGNKQAKRAMVGHSSFNIYLSSFTRKVEDIVNFALTNNIEPTTEYVKDTYNNKKKAAPTKKEMAFDAFVEHHLNMINVSASTLSSYKNAVNNFKAYQKYSNTKLTWESITMDFYHDFTNYYLDVKNCGSNGLGKVLKVLKTLLNAATEQGYNTNMAFKSRSFKIPKEEVDNIYLNEAELDKLIKLDLTSNKKLNRVRDLFIIGCYTGLRFSDLSTITHNNFIGNTIRLETQKTKTRVIIPVLDETKAILKKYNGSIPKAYSNQKMNQYLKELGALAGINETVIKSKKKKDHKIGGNFYKWQLIQTHTARRSYATNMFLRGASPINIMQITGHTTQESFMKYIKISKEENALIMLEQFQKAV